MIRAVVVASVWTASALAQAGPPIPIRQLAPIEATAKEPFRGTAVRAWVQADGGVQASVRSAMRGGVLRQYDPMLAASKVIADSTMILPGNIPFGGFVTMRYVRDTVAFIDGANSAVVILDKEGKQVRVMALPHTRDMREIATGYTWSEFDPQGRLLYRVTRPTPPNAPPRAGREFRVNDSVALVRADFVARSVDTVAIIGVHPGYASAYEMVDGTTISRQRMMPNQPVDDWVVLADGTVAIVRGRDYHIDWIKPDGSRTSSPKMQFDWRRLTDGDKQRLVDSVKAVYDPQDRYTDSLSNARGRGAPPSIRTERSYAPASEVPDYYAPIRIGNLFADPDNRLWVLPTTSLQAAGGLLYDVVNAAGVIVERVQLPPGAALAAVGPNGVVILRVPGETPYEWRLARTHIIRPKVAQHSP